MLSKHLGNWNWSKQHQIGRRSHGTHFFTQSFWVKLSVNSPRDQIHSTIEWHRRPMPNGTLCCAPQLIPSNCAVLTQAVLVSYILFAGWSKDVWITKLPKTRKNSFTRCIRHCYYCQYCSSVMLRRSLALVLLRARVCDVTLIYCVRLHG